MSTNHTPNYQLNQWERTDKVIMEDFNADNAIIDAALAKKADQSALRSLQASVNAKAEDSALAALQSLVNKKGNCRIEMGSYVGDGTDYTSITTSFPPKVVLIMASPFGIAVRPNTTLRVTSSIDRTAIITWRDDGVSWKPASYTTTHGDHLNAENITYYYAVLG